MVAGLASEYGFSEHFVLYELPFSRAIGYLHCLEMGSFTHWPVNLSGGDPDELPAPVISAERLQEIFADEF